MPTQLAIEISRHASIVLPVVGGGLIVCAVIALRKATARTLNRMTAINFIIAALLPGWVYLAVHLPIIELQTKRSLAAHDG